MKLPVFAAALILLFDNGTIRAAERIRVGVPQQVVHWMVFPLAQQKGFFKEEGFDAEIVRITGPSGRSALVSGDIDYYTTIAFIVQSAVVGLPVRLVAGYVNCPPFVLMSRPELKSAQDLKGKTVILVDDGLATGASMRAAVAAIRATNAAQVVAAIPVAEPEGCDAVAEQADDTVCGFMPQDFLAVGQWYEEFAPTSDEEVRELLARAA